MVGILINSLDNTDRAWFLTRKSFPLNNIRIRSSVESKLLMFKCNANFLYVALHDKALKVSGNNRDFFSDSLHKTAFHF